MQRTLRSPGLFTWKPSVSWVVGVRCHCPGGGQLGHLTGPSGLEGGRRRGSRVVPDPICAAGETVVCGKAAVLGQKWSGSYLN